MPQLNWSLQWSHSDQQDHTYGKFGYQACLRDMGLRLLRGVNSWYTNARALSELDKIATLLLRGVLLYSNNAEFFLRPSEGFLHERDRSYLDQDSYITSTILLRALVS